MEALPQGSEPETDSGATPSGRSTWLTLAIAIAPATVAGYLLTRYSYLLFHGIVEMAAAVVAGAVFLVTWHSRRFLDNDYVGVVGTSFLAVAAVSIVHTFAYKGMGAFPGGGTDLPTQLWLVTRYLTAGAFLAAPFFVRRKVDLRLVLGVSFGAATLLVTSIFLGVFPHAFVEGQGLTPFKIASEYVVMAALAVSAAMLYRERRSFDPGVLRLLMGAIFSTIGAEAAFTLYQDPYGASNLIGHILLAVTAFLIYQALVRTALEDPYTLLFRRLKQRETALATAAALSQGLNRAAEAIGSTLDFDDIMRRVIVVAAEALSADAVVVSMVRPEGWVVRYAHGYADDLIDRHVTPGEGRHLEEATARRDVLTVADTESRESANVVFRPFVRELGVRAFATVPLIVRDEAIGVITFHYWQPHKFADAERDFVRKLAAFIALATENARLYAAEHEIAETLQAGLTSDLQPVPGIDVGCVYVTSPGLGRIGGDFFDVFPIGDEHAVFLIGDVAGKGFSAATMTATVRGAARALAQRDPAPAQVMAGLNESLARRTRDGSFVTMLYGLVHTGSGRVELAVAGHPLPQLCRDGYLPDLEHIIGPPLGVSPDRAYLSASMTLDRGDMLVMYTDGVIDARDCGEPLGEDGVRRILRENADLSPGELAAVLAQAATGYASGGLVDDIAVLALVYTGV